MLLTGKCLAQFIPAYFYRHVFYLFMNDAIKHNHLLFFRLMHPLLHCVTDCSLFSTLQFFLLSFLQPVKCFFNIINFLSLLLSDPGFICIRACQYTCAVLIFWFAINLHSLSIYYLLYSIVYHFGVYPVTLYNF